MRIVSAFNYCKEMFLRNMSLWPKGLCVQSWCRAAATCFVCLFALGLSDSTVSAVVWCCMGRLLIITPELLHKPLHSSQSGKHILWWSTCQPHVQNPLRISPESETHQSQNPTHASSPFYVLNIFLKVHKKLILLIHAHFKWTILSLVIECSLDEAMAHWYSNACACKFVGDAGLNLACIIPTTPKGKLLLRGCPFLAHGTCTLLQKPVHYFLKNIIFDRSSIFWHMQAHAGNPESFLLILSYR